MSEEQTAILYRPVGGEESRLVAESGYSKFPPRLPEQPIFYPVINEEYAMQIARDWNAKQGATRRGGYVTRFRVRSQFLQRYETQTVASAVHQELWVPAEQLEAFNANIIGPIEVIAEFAGSEDAGGA
jgi:hypothetical protein